MAERIFLVQNKTFLIQEVHLIFLILDVSMKGEGAKLLQILFERR